MEKNKLFRLENRKIQCLKHLLEEKEEKIRPRAGMMFTASLRSNSMKTLPPRTLALGAARPEPLGSVTQRNPSLTRFNQDLIGKKG